jgi:hypothetical protein
VPLGRPPTRTAFSSAILRWRAEADETVQLLLDNAKQGELRGVLDVGLCPVVGHRHGDPPLFELVVVPREGLLGRRLRVTQAAGNISASVGSKEEGGKPTSSANSMKAAPRM